MSATFSSPLVASAGPGWRRGLVALVMLWALTAWLYRDTALAMIEIWNRSDTFAHAWVVPPITLWLAWRLRHPLLALDPRPALGVLLLFLPAGLLWLMGELVAVNTAKQFALVGLLVTAVPVVLGLSVARLLAFPLGFLFFAVPAGDFLTPTLMSWTADFTVGALRATGIPVFREGMQFVIPSGRWSVVEACSGTRYLIASVMVGTLFAYLNYRSTQRRLLFIGVAIAVPILANWVRAYMIVMLGHLSGNELAVGADHLVYGWVLFGVVIMLLYAIGSRWAEHMPDPAPVPASQASWPAGRSAAALGLAAMLLAWPMVAWQRIDSVAQASVAVPLELPSSLPGNWRAFDDIATDWQPGFRSPSATARGGYVGGDGSRGGIFVGYYRQQSVERKLVSSLNGFIAAEDGRWIQVDQGGLAVPGPNGVLHLREARLLQAEASVGPGAARQRLRVWRFYWVDGQLVAGDAQAKLLGAWGRLLGRGDDSAVIMFYTDDVEVERARATVAKLAAAGLPALVDILGQLRQRVQQQARGR